MRKLLLAFCIALVLQLLSAQERFPLDESIATGTLPNGLKYYLLPSWRSGNKINFYLVNFVGSTVEQADERGFSHFVEHMAYNGTKNFPGNEMQELLEAKGLKFGADFNAYTSQDYTVYSICDVPSHAVDSTKLYLKCLEMLRDISAYVSFEEKEVERERKIILEEWRQNQNASSRIRQQMGDILFGTATPYTQLPIGTYQSLSSLTPQDLRAYYKQWYQPQHQALIVIGDIAIGQLIIDIKQTWKEIKAPKNPSVREWAQVPDHQGLKTGIITDPELGGNQLEIWFKLDEPARQDRDLESYVIESLIGYMASSTLSQRLKDIIYEPYSPFTNAAAEIDNYYGADSKDAFRIRVNYDRNLRQNALGRLIQELKRIKVSGLTESELAEVKDALKKSAENTAMKSTELNNYKQWNRISEYVLKGNVVMSPLMQKRVFQTFADTVTTETINQFLHNYITLDNAVSILAEKDVPDDSRPDSCCLAEWIFDAWEKADTSDYIPDDSRTKPLIPYDLQSGKIIGIEIDSLMDSRTYTLSNGAKVIAAFKDLRRNQIDMRAVRPGGITAFSDGGFADAQYAALALEISGLGEFSATQLARRLAGKDVDIEINHFPYSEIVQGSSSLEDLETMLQLMHLRMTTFRRDSIAFVNWKRIRQGLLHDMENDPGRIFSDSIRTIMYGQNHPYLRQIHLADLDSLDYNHAMALGKSRLDNPAAYDFIITGNIDYKELEPLLEKYIGSLPPRDSTPFPAVKPVSRTMRPGHRTTRFAVPAQEGSSRVYIAFEILRPYSIENDMALEVLRDILERELVQTLRADQGGTYSPQVGCNAGEVDGYLSLFFSFDTNSESAETLAEQAINVLKQIAKNGVNPQTFTYSKEYVAENEHAALSQQQFPLQYYTHLAIYGCDHLKHKYQAALDITPEKVKELAADFVNAPASVQIIMDIK